MAAASFHVISASILPQNWLFFKACTPCAFMVHSMQEVIALNHWLSSLSQAQWGMAALERYNRQSAPLGLRLSEQAWTRLLQHRDAALRQTNRIEGGEGALGKLIAAFCDSPYIVQNAYEETLMELQELFYSFKNECHDLVSDDELIGAMRLIYNEVARGSTEYVAGVGWETMVQIAVTASVEGTELERPPFGGGFDGEEYE